MLMSAMLMSAIQKQSSDCSFYFIKSLYGISNLERKKEKQFHLFNLYC